MRDNYISRIFKFILFAEGLKNIERFKGQFYWRDYPTPKRYESVADHSWRLALLIIVLEKRLKRKINLNKALKMAAIHDLHEIISGDQSPIGETGTGEDTYAFNEKLKRRRFLSERRDAKALYGMLPKKEAKELLRAWYKTSCRLI